MRSRLVRGCVAAAVASVTLASIGRAAAFRKGPYLIYPGTNTEMTVLWQADSSPSNSYVEWGVDTGYGSSSGALTESGPGADEHQFEHTITGLTPAARYYYRVHVDANPEAGSFLAAPAASATSVTLYGFGDTRSRPLEMDKVCGRLVTDVDTSPDTRQTMILHSGDWVGDGEDETHWDGQFFNRSYANTLSFQSRVPVMGCVGNHGDPGVLLRKYYPHNYQDAVGCYYSFDYGPVHVTVIDQYVSYTGGSAQHTWVDNDLASTSKPWKIVVLHEPAWGAGTHSNSTTTQNELCPLFEANDVAVTVAGHNHNYVRCLVNGIHHLTLGGGGAPLYDPDPGYPNVVKAEKTLHFARFDISDTTMTVTIVRDDGTIVESFSINKGPDLTPPDVSSAGASGDPRQVTVVFSEPVEAGTGANGAENTANYAVPGFTVTGASLDASTMVVTLTLGSDMTDGSQYSVTVSGVNDRASPANTMSSPQTENFTFTAGPITVFAEGDVWRYFKGTSFPGAGWKSLGFDDSSWLSGPTGIGYGDGDDVTVLSDMQNGYLTVYMRRDFSVADASSVTSLTFTVDYDDGFVAFINGTEVARRDVAAGQDQNTAATGHEAGTPEVIDLTARTGSLVDGTNVFAIELHNTSLTSSDASMIPELAMESSGPAGTPPAITGPSSLQSGMTATSYSETFTATGDQPITWSVSGGSLPPGMSLGASTGVLSGTPTAAGTFSFTIKATNAAGSDTAAYSLDIQLDPTLDTDGDGMTDVFEIEKGFNPNNGDQDGNGVLDGLDDWDGDGVDNQNDTNPGRPPSSGWSTGLGCAPAGLGGTAFLTMLLALAAFTRRRARSRLETGRT